MRVQFSKGFPYLRHNAYYKTIMISRNFYQSLSVNVE